MGKPTLRKSIVSKWQSWNANPSCQSRNKKTNTSNPYIMLPCRGKERILVVCKSSDGNIACPSIEQDRLQKTVPFRQLEGPLFGADTIFFALQTATVCSHKLSLISVGSFAENNKSTCQCEWSQKGHRGERGWRGILLVSQEKNAHLLCYFLLQNNLTSLRNQFENTEKHTEDIIYTHSTAQVLRWPHEHLGTYPFSHVCVNSHIFWFCFVLLCFVFCKKRELCTHRFVASFFHWIYFCEHFSTSLHFLLTPSFEMAT